MIGPNFFTTPWSSIAAIGLMLSVRFGRRLRPQSRRSASQRSQSQSACSPPLRVTTIPSGPPSTFTPFHRVEFGTAFSASAISAGISSPFPARTRPSRAAAWKGGVETPIVTSLTPVLSSSPSRAETGRPCRSPFRTRAPWILGPIRGVTGSRISMLTVGRSTTSSPSGAIARPTFS